MLMTEAHDMLCKTITVVIKLNGKILIKIGYCLFPTYRLSTWYLGIYICIADWSW